MDENELGLKDAAEALEALRNQTGAGSGILFFGTPNGAVALVADDDGFRMFVDGEPVPMRGAA